jgi:hypothetical protein
LLAEMRDPRWGLSGVLAGELAASATLVTAA